MESKEIREISLEELKLYTDNFSQEKFVGNFQFGKVYRGQIGDSDVIVKIWLQTDLYWCNPGDNEARLDEELQLQTDPRIKSHPNLAKLIGYCLEGQLGVVYDLNPVDTLRTFILKDDFPWSQRIKVAHQFACLLKFLHAPCPPLLPYLIRNLEATHFLLDKDYNLVLYDFGMMSGGVLPERSKLPPGPVCRFMTLYGCYGYIDPYPSQVDHWYEESDVWAFGVVLLGLISKRVFIVEDHAEEYSIRSDSLLIDLWAVKEHERRRLLYGDKASLVHENLEVDCGFEPIDGIEITKLAMQCIEYFFEDRPTMEQVVQRLSELHVLKHPFETWASSRL
ncbi:hypothetical protein V6N13_099868 [Hibiscus sabdariffa]|uniref:Protein kinase domain-containing protein n=2 Tax=Hibiscus sabdariffa TaxID=183260 RepID=A0ABR2AA63_9ROSI